MPLNETFPFSCANGGGRWFTCDSGTRFLGCCRRDPCQTGCPPDDRLPAYFNPRLYTTFENQLCGIDDGLFYTCAESGFFGCCKSDACTSAGRCPYKDLGSIVLSTDTDQVAYFTPGNWNQRINVQEYHQQLQQLPSVDTDAIVTGTLLRNPFPTSITLALALIGLLTWASFGMLLLSLVSHKRRKTGDAGMPYLAMERMPLTNPKPQPLTQNSPSISQTLLSSPIPPTTQLKSPLSSKTWSSYARSAQNSRVKHSPTSNMFVQAVISTRQRPHKTAHVLMFMTCLVLALLTTFLALLWFDNSSQLWQYVMSRNYITRLVAISTLIVRAMVDIQACVAATMLAAVFLESHSGVNLADSVAISMMRFDTTPSRLVNPILQGLAQQSKDLSYSLLSMLLICLVTTTMLLQLSSTALLMDLAIGSLPGLAATRKLPVDFSYQCMSDTCNQVYLNQIPRISSWGMNPPFFPAFAEMKAVSEQTNPQIADTGMLIRAFPPYTEASARQSIQRYEGKAFVIDSRVSCQAPTIDDLVWTNATYSNFTGTISSTTAAPLLNEIVPTKFSCTYGGINQLSLCQISNNPFDTYTGSLACQFMNNTVEDKFYKLDERPANFGTAFLVVQVLNASEVVTSLQPDVNGSTTEFIYDKEWLHLKKTTPESSAALALSLCFAPWEAARLPVSLESDHNRSEPLTTWQPPQFIGSAGSFDMSQVLRQLGVGASKNMSLTDRGLLQLNIPSFEVMNASDRRPRSQRPFIQTDASQIGLSFGGANVPIAANWTIFLSGNILPKILPNFSYVPQHVLAADPAIANLFSSALEQSNVAWAMSSVITVLSATSYYNQMPAFDYVSEVKEVFFEPVLIPLSTFGFTTFVYVLAAHIVITAVVVGLFKTNTRLSLVGESWAAIAPLLAEIDDHNFGDENDEKVQHDIREILENASELTDGDVWGELRRRGTGKRTVRLGEEESGSEGQTSIKFQVVR